ncbi:type I-C CRISPR-associated protein Cas8c/Csd1 [Rhodoferax antarcticus]|uniref:type I-C CRISPR-associated protein Cas8c/Csd1 n=1 Tax=Rhodoferax antarcticus TaxID=81479 RepID=UPI0022258CE7|nr:type I-C CRISPR-associated protein Cas8c/Csd1 [Rhodoferax antarcticus]MCW2311084.1 CRISPR-associated protein Csd1 [Rhodoferax antarcticus]
MSWIQKLYETYEQCWGRESPGEIGLLPIGHTPQQAHIEITIEANGKFKSARTIQKVETVIPATEKSAGRTANCAPHPLCDKVQYCAIDYPKYGGKKPSFFEAYEEQLNAWCESEFSHPKARAVHKYVRAGRLISDLVNEKVLHLGTDGTLLTQWTNEGQAPDIFRFLTAKEGARDQGDAFIRWQVWEPGNPCSAVWEDQTLQNSWTGYDASTKKQKGVCMVTGDGQAALAMSHPKRIRHAGDGAKLISANDGSGYTFRGRFTDDTGLQACGVGYEVTQKAHNALRWLIQRQAYRNEDQVIVTWTVAGKPVPDPFKDSLSLFLSSEDASESVLDELEANVGDVGQAFALRLKKAIAGYRAKLELTENIIVMGLDSATPGRMAISFYRELKGSEFLDRIESWHTKSAWLQNFGKNSKFVGAPAPCDIAEAAYGRRIDYKLRRSTIERLLPCIVDGQSLPRDLVDSVVRRSCNRVGMEHWDWEKNLGIACSLFKCFFNERDYQMTLEADRTSRDYLYGRLLAVAEHIEGRALYVGKETRDTTAAKLMQRFADRPASTWRTIELALAPSKSRLRAKRPAFLYEMERLHDTIACSFVGDDFLDDKKLSGEFLLGYHCQRRELNPPKVDAGNSAEDTPTE